MKTLNNIASIVILLLISIASSAQDHYFYLIEGEKDKVNSIVTSTVSIDRVKGDTIFAFANNNELKSLLDLGYRPQMLPFPSVNSKAIVMATTIDEMAGWDRYPTYEVYRQMMKQFESKHPTLCKLDSIGTSVNGRKLYVIKISDDVDKDEPELELFYTSTMHGDETTGYILMLRLIDYLLTNYGSDERVTNLINNVAIYINPNSNPDGTYYYGNNTVSGSRRYNANGYDLNRNFPDPRAGDNPNGPHQPENIAMMDFAKSRNFVLSGNFHGGIELANYPWDTWTSTTNRHADHNWFYSVSRQYADSAQANSPSGYFTGMNNGVTHGGDWYVVAGGRQDYMNYWHHCREVTFEISDTKNPSSSDLPNYWIYSKEALLTYMEHLFTGIQGVVTNSQGAPLSATISITNHDKDNSQVVTNPKHGNYFRPIEPGVYSVTYSATGYESVTISNVSVEKGAVVLKNVVLGGTSTLNSTEGVVTNSQNGSPIPNASITVVTSEGKHEFTANEEGKFTLSNVPLGLAIVYAEAQGYLRGSFYVPIYKETNQVDIKLTQIQKHTVTFNVKNKQSQGVQGASITFNSQSITTDSEGKAIFTEIYNGKYTYRADAEGYIAAEDEVDITDDKTVDITLIPLGAPVLLSQNFDVNVWPNPFGKKLSIYFNLPKPASVEVLAVNLLGVRVASISSKWYPQGNHTLEWFPLGEIAGTHQGVYIVHVKINGVSVPKRIVFNPSQR